MPHEKKTIIVILVVAHLLCSVQSLKYEISAPHNGEVCYYDNIRIEGVGPHPTLCMELSCESNGKVLVQECDPPPYGCYLTKFVGHRLLYPYCCQYTCTAVTRMPKRLLHGLKNMKLTEKKEQCVESNTWTSSGKDKRCERLSCHHDSGYLVFAGCLDQFKMPDGCTAQRRDDYKEYPGCCWEFTCSISPKYPVSLEHNACTEGWLSDIRSKLQIALRKFADQVTKSTFVDVKLEAGFHTHTLRSTLHGLHSLALTDEVTGACSVMEIIVVFTAVATKVSSHFDWRFHTDYSDLHAGTLTLTATGVMFRGRLHLDGSGDLLDAIFGFHDMKSVATIVESSHKVFTPSQELTRAGSKSFADAFERLRLSHATAIFKKVYRDVETTSLI